METTRPLAWGAAIRWLRWAPMIAGLIAFDAITGVDAVVGAAAVTVDIGLLCWLVYRALTKDIDHPKPPITWIEGLFVGALTCSLLGMQVAFTDPGGVTGRGMAVLSALLLGTLLTEMVEARRAIERERRPLVRRATRTYVAG
jgi:uncharacterized YccA/Bax inhibitor family protein